MFSGGGNAGARGVSLLQGVIQCVPDGKIVKVGMQDSQGEDAR